MNSYNYASDLQGVCDYVVWMRAYGLSHRESSLLETLHAYEARGIRASPRKTRVALQLLKKLQRSMLRNPEIATRHQDYLTTTIDPLMMSMWQVRHNGLRFVSEEGARIQAREKEEEDRRRGIYTLLFLRLTLKKLRFV